MKLIERVRHEIMAMYILIFSRALVFPIVSGVILLLIIIVIVWGIMR